MISKARLHLYNISPHRITILEDFKKSMQATNQYVKCMQLFKTGLLVLAYRFYNAKTGQSTKHIILKKVNLVDEI